LVLHIVSKSNHLYVLRVLNHADEPLTGREVERRTGLSNRAVMLALEALVEASAVRREETPQAHWYEINPRHYLIARALKPAFEAEDLFWDDLRKTIRRVVHPRPIAAVATGPFARDEALSEGRLNVTMLFASGRNRIRAFRSMDPLREEIWERYALGLAFELLDINIMDREEYDSIWKRVEREGILFYGKLP